MVLEAAADGLVVAELDKTHFSQGEVRLEDTQHAVGHFGEHHSKLDGERGDPSHPEQFSQELAHFKALSCNLQMEDLQESFNNCHNFYKNLLCVSASI